MARLTTKDCERLLAAGVPEGRTVVKHSDGGGLYLVVRAGRDTASWLYRSRSGDKNLGSFPDVVPKAARDALVTYRAGLLATAADTPRQASKAAGGKTFRQMVAEWLPIAKTGRKRPWAEKTTRQCEAALLRLPFADTSIEAVTDADVLGALRVLKRVQAERIRQDAARVFAYAIGKGFRTGHNPAKFDDENRRESYHAPSKDNATQLKAVDWSDIPKVFAALADTPAGNAVRFQILTAARPGEVEQATYSEIIGENGTSAWVPAVEHMKARKAHRVPLVPQALALLGKGAPADPLFELRSNHMLKALQDVAPGMSVHSSGRSAFKTWASDNGKDRELVEMSLAHAFGGNAENSYKRTDLLARRRKLLEEWADFVTGATPRS